MVESLTGYYEGVKNKYAEDLQNMQSECATKVFEQLRTYYVLPVDNPGHTLTHRHRTCRGAEGSEKNELRELRIYN